MASTKPELDRSPYSVKETLSCTINSCRVEIIQTIYFKLAHGHVFHSLYYYDHLYQHVIVLYCIVYTIIFMTIQYNMF